MDTSLKPFTEKDFDKYYSMLFSKAFVQCLLKIKTADLYKKGETESPALKDSATTFKLYATHNKESNTIELNFSINTVYKAPDSNEAEVSESNIIYYFRVLNNGHIKFKQLRIAG